MYQSFLLKACLFFGLIYKNLYLALELKQSFPYDLHVIIKCSMYKS